MMRKRFFLALNRRLLHEQYPELSEKEALDTVRNFLVEHGFEHKRRWGYLSRTEMSFEEAEKVIKELGISAPWVLTANYQLILDEMGEPHSLLDIIKKTNPAELNDEI